MTSNLVWLASYPKSGNTWLRCIVWHLRKGLDADFGSSNLPDCYYTADRFMIESLSSQISSELSRQEIDDLRLHCCLRLAAESEDLVVLKSHDCFGTRALGGESFPWNATRAVIYVVRNPLDVSVSLASHLGVTVERAIELMADSNFTLAGGPVPDPQHLPQLLGSWSQHVRAWTEAIGGRVVILRYEDLHARPTEALRAVVASLGVDADAGRVAEAVEKCRFSRLQARERDEGFSERSRHANAFFRSGKVGTWQRVLAPRQIQRILRDHGETMARWAYSDKEHDFN